MEQQLPTPISLAHSLRGRDSLVRSRRPDTLQGVPIVDRWVTEIVDDKVSFVGHEAIGDGDFFEHVRGEMKRTNGKPTEFDVVDAAFVPELVATAQKELKRFAPSRERPAAERRRPVDRWRHVARRLPIASLDGRHQGCQTEPPRVALGRLRVAMR